MSFFANLKISKKLAAAFAGLIIVMLAVTATIYGRLSFIQMSAGWTEHTYMVLENLQAVMESMVDQETGVRGYLVSGDQQFLAPYKSGQNEFEKSFARVKELTSDNSTQQQRLSQIRGFVQRWHDDVVEKEIALMGKPETRADAAKLEASGAGKTSMDGIRGVIGEMDKAERDLLQVRSADQASAFSTAFTVSIAGGVLSLVVSIGLAWLLTSGISGPIVRMTEAMKRLAGGDKAVEIPGVGRQDEIGAMAGAVQVFKDTAIEAERLAAQQAGEQATRERRALRLEELMGAFEAKVGQVVNTVSSASTQLEASAGTLTATAVRSQELTTTVAAASEEASTNVQSVASATEELSSSVNEISRQVQESARMANEAVSQARQTNDRVGELSRAASRIGDVVELINTIAGQTNLLALNATIEAARAGEAGRGFAVVASEVKALAEQTAKATGEIGLQITGIQAATQESVGAIKEISNTIGKLSEISSTIAAAVEEQGAATQEISRNVQQAAQGTQQVSSNITDVQRGASETGSASSQVLTAAKSLSGESSRLKREVGKFLSSVRAA